MIDDETKRKKLIEAVLNHIPFDGWSPVSLEMAAADCELSKTEMHNLFPEGIADAIAAYSAYADKNMLTAFQGEGASDTATMPVHIKIRTLILIRLKQAACTKRLCADIDRACRPQHAKLAAQLCTAQLMRWRAAEIPQQIIISTKRATLSAVYSATLLAFLSDNSADMAKTEAFLDRRLADVARLPKMARPAKAMVDMVMRFTGPIMRGRRAR